MRSKTRKYKNIEILLTISAGPVWFSDGVYNYLLAHKATLNPTDFLTYFQYTCEVSTRKRVRK